MKAISLKGMDLGPNDMINGNEPLFFRLSYSDFNIDWMLLFFNTFIKQIFPLTRH